MPVEKHNNLFRSWDKKKKCRAQIYLLRTEDRLCRLPRRFRADERERSRENLREARSPETPGFIRAITIREEYCSSSQDERTIRRISPMAKQTRAKLEPGLTTIRLLRYDFPFTIGPSSCCRNLRKALAATDRCQFIYLRMLERGILFGITIIRGYYCRRGECKVAFERALKHREGYTNG